MPTVAGPTVRVAGRIMLRRGQGKVNFLQLRDWTGAIQIFIGKNQVGELGWTLADLLDLGDLIGVDGTLGLTKTGELTVFADEPDVPRQEPAPPPEKWHGLTDVEQRSRQRYVDLFSNPESLAVFLGRSKVIAAFRKVLGERGFVEVETPTMQPIAGGAAARPFVTHHNTLDLQLYLRIAPELYLKRLLVGGMERVFEIGRVYPQRGDQPQAQPRVHHDGGVPGLRRLSQHDGSDRSPDLSARSMRSTATTSRPWGDADRSTSPPPGLGRPTPSSSRSTPAST